jgi:hypothetical protein
MALHTELPVYRDRSKLVLEIFVGTKNFLKEYKYSLGRDMERDVLVLMPCIYRALLERNLSFVIQYKTVAKSELN